MGPSSSAEMLVDNACYAVGVLSNLASRVLGSDVRASIDPELMIRMLIVGYGFGIRSERRLRRVMSASIAPLRTRRAALVAGSGPIQRL